MKLLGFLGVVFVVVYACLVCVVWNRYTVVQETKEVRRIVLFDGVCNMCNGFVNFLLDYDTEELLTFAALQSDKGKQLLEEFGNPVEELESMVFVEGTECYTHSTAVLKTISSLPMPFPILYAFTVLPKLISDTGYSFVASTRYSVFGKTDECRAPNPHQAHRFL